MKSHAQWVYLPPALHLVACAMSVIGYVFPPLSCVGIVWTFVMLLDLPVSIVAYLLAWKSSNFAVVWIFVIGTWWWFFLSCAAEKLMLRERSKSISMEP